MDEQRQDDQRESEPIKEVDLKTYRKRCTIEKSGGRGSGISMLMAQHDDDDDEIYGVVSPFWFFFELRQCLLHSSSGACRNW